MNRADWFACDDVSVLLRSIQSKASERRLRLFACACVRRVWSLLFEPASRRAVEVAERIADGTAGTPELTRAGDEADRVANQLATRSFRDFEGCSPALWDARNSAAYAALNTTRPAFQAADCCSANAASAVFHAATDSGAPSSAAARDAEHAAQCRLLRELFTPLVCPVRLDGSVLAWENGTVGKMARTLYEERAFDQLPALADALEDAGCADAEILDHCRAREPHVRGCWVLDMLLALP
jgi:hypothetical protein